VPGRVARHRPVFGDLRGLFARAKIIINPNDEALCVPVSAIVAFAGLEKVVVVKDGKAQEKVVATGRREPEWVEIVSGLKPGENVVADPVGLRTGQLVAITGTNEGSSGHPQKEIRGRERQGLN
jgi:multidrug efflux pump subunit AcrA (membrane-fusion protein)